MNKTSVYLDEHQAERLKRLAEAEGRSQAEIVRQAIALYRSPANQPPRKFAMEGVAPGLAQRLGYRSIMDIPEEELLKGFGE
jgi:predicted transcriptional regulator